MNIPSAPPAVYDRGVLRDVGDSGRGGVSLGNVILKAAGAVNWQGTGAEEVEAGFRAVDANGGEQGTETQRVQRELLYCTSSVRFSSVRSVDESREKHKRPPFHAFLRSSNFWKWNPF